VLLGVVLGAAAQLQQPRLWPLVCYAAATALASAWLIAALAWRRRRRTRMRMRVRLGAILLAATALSAALTGWRAAAFVTTRLASTLEGRDIAVTGVVASMTHRSEAGLRFRFEPESARLDGRELVLPPQLMLGWYGGADSASDSSATQPLPAELRPGERWQWTVRLKAPHGQVNPHGFDYELWLWEQDVQATGYVRNGARDPPPRRLGATWQYPLEQARQRVREAIYAEVADPRLAGVLAALVVGDQGAIERADWDVFRATGVAHLMSISGLHVTMFAWAAAALLGRLWRRSARLCLAWPAQQAGLAGGIALAAAYAVFSGGGVPAQRTVFMLAAVGVLRLGARDWPWPHVWLLACATVVAIDPWALTQAGFWLSFVAVGVLFASGPPHRPDAAAAARGRIARLAHALAALAREQWTVTIALTPLSLLLFGQASVVGLVANLVAIPWVTLVVTPLAMAGVLVAPLWTMAAAAVDLLAWFLRLLAVLPYATWSAPTPPLWAAGAGVLGGMLLAARLPPTLRAFGIPLVLPVLLWQAPRPPPGAFDLLAADVGQGNAVIVRTAQHTLVYDAGPGYSRETDAGQRVLVPLLRAGGERVDLLVLSHRDTDHTGGAAAVLRMQPAAAVLSSIEDDHALRALRPVTRCAGGQQWDWDGVHFEVLHPAAADYEAPARSNAMSCVLRVGTAGAHVLLAGDLERAQEAALVDAGAPLASDLLLVPHHGSRSSSSPVFLDAVQPWAALVQAGYRNRFGHPAPEVAQRYRDRAIVLAQSPQCGAVGWDSRAPRTLRCERAADPHYWRHDAMPADTAGR
jgi:competence protein ComEC